MMNISMSPAEDGELDDLHYLHKLQIQETYSRMRNQDSARHLSTFHGVFAKLKPVYFDQISQQNYQATALMCFSPIHFLQHPAIMSIMIFVCIMEPFSLFKHAFFLGVQANLVVKIYLIHFFPFFLTLQIEWEKNLEIRK